MQQCAYTRGKNTTDSALIIDAMDLLYTGRSTPSRSSPATATSPGWPLRLRESGATVYGLGQRKTPESFRAACNRFIELELLGGGGGSGEPADEPEDQRGAEDGAAPRLPDLRRLLTTAVNKTSADDGWATMSTLGNYLTNLNASFDPRSYGSAKLSTLVKAQDYLEVKGGERHHPHAGAAQAGGPEGGQEGPGEEGGDPAVLTSGNRGRPRCRPMRMTSSRTRRLSLAALVPLILGVLLMAAACSGSSDQASSSEDAAPAADAPADSLQGNVAGGAPAPAPGQREAAAAGSEDFSSGGDTASSSGGGREAARPPVQTRAVISTGTVRYESEDVDETRRDVQQVVDAHGGDVTDEDSETDDDGETSCARGSWCGCRARSSARRWRSSSRSPACAPRSGRRRTSPPR